MLVVLILASSMLTLPYYAIAPGSAREVNDLIRAPEDHNFPPRGEVLLATVSLRRVTALDALQGWLDRDIDVVPEEQILGTTKPKDLHKVNIELMDDSKQVATVVALRKAGFNVGEHGEGALVAQVNEGAPAEGRLEAGEVITAVDGRPMTLSDDVIAVLKPHRPGDVVRLDVSRGDEAGPRTEDVKLGSAPADRSSCRADGPADGLPCLGVSLRTKGRRFDLPFQIDIDSGQIGGPSAGLAFALGVIDAITPGELTGGRRVAATGTIDINENVGPVGGVYQKTAAVKDQDAELFLVPPQEYEDAVKRAGRDIKVVQVSTLDDALAALADEGGDVSALGSVGAAAPG
jgi:PDZ domain-containing protein